MESSEFDAMASFSKVDGIDHSGQTTIKNSSKTKSKMIHSNLDVHPTCVLVKLSQNEPPLRALPKIQHGGLPKYTCVPDDILTNLHSNMQIKGQKQR